jgi:uncharacterized protein (TIRG00374 family)
LKRLYLSILITATILFVLLTQISLKDLFALLRGIDPIWGGVATGAYLFAILFRALRYRWLLHSKEVGLSSLFKICVFYNLSLMVLPSKLGELSYPYFLNKMSSVPLTEGLASLIASRVYDFFLVLIIFLVTAVGAQDLFEDNLFFIIVFALILIGLIFLVFFHMTRILNFSSDVLGKMSRWTRLRNSHSLQWIQVKIHEVAEDFHAIHARRTYLPVALTSLISWIMAYGTCYAFMRGFGIDISFLKVVFGSTVGVIASALPISGLGNWGMLEAGWAAGFLMVGLSKERAIATGFALHIALFVISAVLGLVCWASLIHPKR